MNSNIIIFAEYSREDTWRHVKTFANPSLTIQPGGLSQRPTGALDESAHGIRWVRELRSSAAFGREGLTSDSKGGWDMGIIPLPLMNGEPTRRHTHGRLKISKSGRLSLLFEQGAEPALREGDWAWPTSPHRVQTGEPAIVSKYTKINYNIWLC